MAMYVKDTKQYLDRYGDNPVKWAYEVLGIELWSKQKEILESAFFNPETVVRSCYSAGKTFIAAVLVLAFMYLRSPCKVLTTAPTYNQVVNLLWSEINQLYKTRLAPKGFGGKILKSGLYIEDDWFAEGISPKDPVNMQGYHQRNVLLVFDEAPGVRNDIVEGSSGVLASGNAHILKIGNPIMIGDHFYKDFQSPTLPSQCKIKIAADDTPNFTGEKIPKSLYNSFISKVWVADKAFRWGKNSPMFISKVLADFPAGGVNQIISLELCEAAKRRSDVISGGIRELGVDVARFGDDLTALVLREGDRILNLETLGKRDTMEVTGRIMRRIAEDPLITKVKVDVIGIGAGVVDRLAEQGINVLPINSTDKAMDSKTYYNKRDEMWFDMQRWLATGSLPADDPLVDDLIADLTAPRFIYRSDGRYAVESKDELKDPKRLGRSPDLGDGAVISLATTGIDPDKFYVESQTKSADDLLKSMGM